MEHIDRKNIWCYRQNKPSLVVGDIIKEYPNINPDFIYFVLLKRGIFKWLSIRRKLIKLKNTWKEDIRFLNEKPYRTDKEKGVLSTLIRCRKEIRILCHDDRWQAPDYDKKALD